MVRTFTLATLVLLCAVSGWRHGAEASGPRIEGPLASPAALASAIAEFESWFQQHYTASADVPVTLRAAGDTLRLGVYANRDIAAESIYLAVPARVVISPDTAAAAIPAIREVLPTIQSVMSRPQAALALFLLHEIFVSGPLSFYFPYLRLLPASHDTPEFYSDDDLARLAGTMIPHRVQQRRKQHRDEFASLQRLVFARHPAVWPPAVATYDHWVYVQGLLDTRMIWWDGGPHLVPMLDMINCGELAYNPRRVHRTYRSGTDAVTQAPAPFRRGEQIFENYGQPNPSYFLYHGFVLAPNVHDCAWINASSVPRVGGIDALLQASAPLRHASLADLCVSTRQVDELLAVARLAVLPVGERRRHSTLPTWRQRDWAVERRAVTFAGKMVNQTLAGLAMPPSDGPQPPSDDRPPQPVPFRSQMIEMFLQTQRQQLSEIRQQLKKQLVDIKRRQKREREASKAKRGNGEEL